MSSFRDNRPLDAPPKAVPRSLKYRDGQEYLLRRIGSAIVLQWDALPDELQDLIIDQAAIIDDPSDAPHSARDIEDFVRNVKSVALSKAPGAE